MYKKYYIREYSDNTDSDNTDEEEVTGNMFGTKREMTVVALRDTDAIADELREALATADAAERPGLERAAAIVARVAAVPDSEVRGRWALNHLAAAGHTGPADSVRAVKALRQAEPGLSLATAVQLSKEAAALQAKEPGN